MTCLEQWTSTQNVHTCINLVSLNKIIISFQLWATGDDNEEKQYFIAPTGLLFSEVTASSILKVDHNGSVVEQGNSNLGVSQTVFDLHVTIHSARKDAKCVLFVTADSVNVVSKIFVP